MTSSTSSLELNFFYHNQMQITKFRLSFDDTLVDIKSEIYTINLPDDLFRNGKERSIVSITLYIKEQYKDFSFYVDKGENRVYIGLDILYWSVYQIIIYSKTKHAISQLNKKFEKFDSLGNKYRSRITLINTNPRFNLDGESVDFNNIAIYNSEVNSESYNFFYQISTQMKKDINDDKIKKQFIVKQIQEVQEKDDINTILDKKKVLNDFWADFQNALNNENFVMSYENLKKKHRDIFNMKIPFIKDNNQYINNDMDNLHAFFIAFFVILILKHYSVLKGQKYLKEVFDKANDDFKLISSKTTISGEEKIKILASYLLLYNDCENLSELNTLKIKNFIFAEKEDNSIMDKVYQFYEMFFNELTEDSKIFFYLLQLNSGIGYCHREKVYTFDLTNVETVKKHLIELFPKFLTIYDYNNDKERNYVAFCSRQNAGIAIDLNFLVPNEKCKNIDFNSKNPGVSQNDANEIAMNIVLFLFHEFMDHKKFHNSETRKDSPQKIVINNKLIQLKYELDFKKNDTNSEYILTTKENKGHFLDLCYNKFNDTLILKYLITMKNKGKLINRADLLIKSPELIEKYVILRKIAEEKGMIFNFNDKMSIEEEISEMNSKIDVEKYMKEKKEKEEKEEKEDKSPKSSSSKKSKHQKRKSHLKLSEKVEKKSSSDEISEEEENSEESDEKEKKRKFEDKEMKRILKKFNFKYDEELFYNIESKMDEKGLSQEDYDDLNYLYIKFMKIY